MGADYPYAVLGGRPTQLPWMQMEATTVQVPSQEYPQAPILSHDAGAHAQVKGKEVMFIGWMARRHEKIYSANDTAPTTIHEVTSAD